MKQKQLVITSFSNSIDEAAEIIETEIGMLKSNELLVKNEIVGINAVYDRELYKGAVPYINVIFPYVFGVESVGTIVEVGSIKNNYLLDRHASILKVGTAYQEFQKIRLEDLILIPEASAEYLTINPTGVSALLAMEKCAELKKGETVVVSAAAGGLGHIMVQLCKMKGCHVVAICGGERKKLFLEKFGACDRIINYKSENISEILNIEYQNKIDVGIDSVGRHMFDTLLENLAPLGRLVVIGIASELADTSFQQRMSTRVYESIYWKGASVRCFMNHLFKEDHEGARFRLNKMYQSGKLEIKPDESSFVGIESIKEASKYLLEGKSCGKLVVRL